MCSSLICLRKQNSFQALFCYPALKYPLCLSVQLGVGGFSVKMPLIIALRLTEAPLRDMIYIGAALPQPYSLWARQQQNPAVCLVALPCIG